MQVRRAVLGLFVHQKPPERTPASEGEPPRLTTSRSGDKDR
jgi:hypothetical protein